MDGANCSLRAMTHRQMAEESSLKCEISRQSSNDDVFFAFLKPVLVTGNPQEDFAMTTPSDSLMTAISVRWASPFQKQAREKALREVLQSWREFYMEKNKGNDITIEIDRDPRR